MIDGKAARAVNASTNALSAGAVLACSDASCAAGSASSAITACAFAYSHDNANGLAAGSSAFATVSTLSAYSAKAAAATPEQVELDTRNAYDSLLLAGRAMQNAWKSVKPQLAKLPPDTRAGAINQLTNTLTEIQTEAIKCL